MKISIAAIFAALLLVAACGENQDQVTIKAVEIDAADALHRLFEEHFERNLEMNPLSATFIGDYRYNDRMANTNSPEYMVESMAMDEEFLTRLLEIDREQLEYQDQLSYDLFKISREQSLEGARFPSHLQPINQFYSATSSFVQLGSGTGAHPFKSVKDYDDFLSRADQFAVNVDQIITNMQEGMRQGVTQPRILMEKLVPQVDVHIVQDVTESNFYKPVANMPEEFSDVDRARLTTAYERKIRETIIPAYQRISNFLGDEYIASARETVGLHAQPNGAEWYAYMVRLRTTTDMTPDEIHQIGLDEVARIHEEMYGVIEAVGFEGSLNEFFEFMNTDDRFFYDEPDEMIQGYRDMSENVAELSKSLFDVMPKSGYEVRRVEAFREASSSKGSYQAATPDGSRPGIFYANTYDIKARGKWAMESLFLHEAIPGHHFQIMIQRENEALPGFRRFGGFTAYSEGWGLYAESLGKEIGMYTDPYSYFGGLNAELWRSIRLVVDTGLHAKQWTRQDVLDYMYANSAVAEVRAVSEAERFMAIPGQALAYKVGQLKIREIRNKAEAALGDKFNIKDFHTEVLRDGAMPLSILEAKIDRWIVAQQ
jgi:uncharacterized protein (DUF885 family)